MARILVFGGSVFVGKAIVNRLVNDGHEVYILNRGNHTTPPGANQFIADRNNFEQVNKVLK